MEFHAILNSPIPPQGRHLTSSECRAIRDLGTSCSEAWFVVRRVEDINDLGTLYYPHGNGLTNAKVHVKVKK